MFVGDLPSKLRLTLLQAATAQPIRHVVLVCGVAMRLELRFIGSPKPPDRTLEWEIQLPPATTDHVGYLSIPFDVVRRAEAELLAARDAMSDVVFETFNISVDHVWARCPTVPTFELDLGPQLDPYGPEAIGVPTRGPERILVVATAALTSVTMPVLPSVVDPDTHDWRLSPASFGMVALPIVGEDGCEMLLPSHEAERIVRFAQVLRIPVTTMPRLPHLEDEFSEGLPYRPGRLVEYETVWHPLNHALGRVLYSLTLAPCEAANIATVDWRRSDAETRLETTRQNDSLLHEQRRDRAIDEVLDATVTEWQKGESFLGGTAGVGGYGSQDQGSMWGVTGSHAIGWGTASSEGNRNVEVSSAQRLGDTVDQASRMVRDLRSTVVVQATQAEAETVQTRIVRNHNHSHALTLLYYEVVRHYLITTRAVRERDVVFLPQPSFDFSDRDVVRDHGDVLKAHLLDSTLASAFGDLAGIPADEAAMRRLVQEGALSQLLVRIELGDVTGNGDGGPAFPQRTVARDRFRLLVLTRDGVIRQLQFADASFRHFAGDQILHETIDGMTPITTAVFTLEGFDGVSLDQIEEIGLTFDVRGDVPHQIEVTKIDVRAVVVDGDNARLLDVLRSQPVMFFRADSEWWAAPNRVPSFGDTEARESRVDELLRHLQEHARHYERVLWLATHPADRLAALEPFGWPPDAARGSLSDYTDAIPIGVHGNYLVFTAGDPRALEDAIPSDERIVSLPTRGAFAEVQLSHCNASEFIDDRRFWNWQVSPCNDQPPQIAPVSMGSRYQDALAATPTAMPASGVEIEAPEAAPAPSTLGSLLDSVMRADVFRDMSSREQLAGVLTELTKAAAGVESKRMESLVALREADAEVEKAKIEADASRRANAGEGGAAGTPNGSTPTGDGQSVARQARAYRDAVDREVASGHLTPDQGSALIRENLQRLAGDGAVLDSPTIRDMVSQLDASPYPGRLSYADGAESFTYDTQSMLTPVDYTEREARAVRSRLEGSVTRGDSYFMQSDTIQVPMAETYGDASTGERGFRYRVAEAMARRMFFGTDQGMFAEAMVDAFPDLLEIWTHLRDVGYPVGSPVSLDMFVLRREDPDPTMRWVIAIRFRFPQQSFPDDPIVGDATRGRRTRVEQNITRLSGLLDRFPAEASTRLACLMELARAHDLGFDQSVSLMYLDPLAVALFIDMSSGQQARELMNGVPPGRYMTNAVLELLLLVREDATEAQLVEHARALDLQILESIQVWRRALRSGSNVYANTFYTLKDWVVDQQRTPGTVYNCYSGEILPPGTL